VQIREKNRIDRTYILYLHTSSTIDDVISLSLLVRLRIVISFACSLIISLKKEKETKSRETRRVPHT